MSLASRLAPLCLGLLLAGCIVDPDTGVAVTRTERYLTPQGEQLRTEAVGPEVEALWLDGGSYVRVAAVAESPDAGTALLPGVPAGEYLLRTGTLYALTSAREVELGTAHARRPDVRYTAQGSPASATLSLGGLHPWSAEGSPAEYREDSLQLLAVETGGLATLYLDPPPAQGATSLAGASAQLSSMMTPQFPQLSADGSDTLVLTQLSQHSSGGVRYASARKAATLRAPAYDGTGPLRLDVGLQELPQQALRVDLRSADFAAHAQRVHPQAKLLSTDFSVTPAAYGLAHGWVDYSGELLLYTQAPGEQRSGVRDFQYGDPFPGTWARVGSTMALYELPFTLPSGRSGRAYGWVTVDDELSQLTRAPVAPRILPPTALRVDGADASAQQTLASASPTVSWEPPSEGTPTAYTLRVIHITDPGGSLPLRRSTKARFVLPAIHRSLKLPPGILEPGGHYVLELFAWHAPGWDFARQPASYPFPSAYATALSGLLTAP